MPKNPRIIVTIGGGAIAVKSKKAETTAIDKQIIAFTGKKKPKLLFIPTASSDDEKYIHVMKSHYGDRLGCTFDSLCLLYNHFTKKELSDRILSADIIYVGGGNTLKMMRLWRHLGVDVLLKKAYQKGVVLCGLSAGSICWYEYGHSDSMYYYQPDNWQYIRVRGLGFLQGIHCPHYDSATDGKSRRDSFCSFMKKFPQIGIGIDNNGAIAYINNQYQVLRSQPTAKAYKVWKHRGVLFEEEIPYTKTLQPVTRLWTKPKKR